MNRFIILFSFTIYAFFSFSQQREFDINAPLPFDPNIKKGKLDNGLTYYIRENHLPEKRAELRLLVNAGSLQETDNQRGLAHFTEHMCFNGTRNFEKNELVSFLEQMGIKFGPELNAYTSFEETVYMLYIPTDKPGLLDTAFMILEDWAQYLTFDHNEIDKERNVIKEEWRAHLGARERMMQQFIPVILKDSKYAERLPIGKMEIVENCHYDTLMQFYKDWYRPELIAVVVVGDINADEIEQKIINHFSHLQNPENPKPHVEYPIPNNKEPLISIVTDKEATYSIIEFYIKHDKKIETTIGDYRELILQSLYNQMMNSRFQEILQKPDAPFIFANSGYGGFIGRSKDSYFSVAVAKENLILASLQKVIEENEKVIEFGFTKSELERAKKDLLKYYEKAVKEIDKTESKSYAEEYKRNFLEKEPIPGIENEFKMAEHFMPGITIEEINSLAKKWLIDENWAILITAPESEQIIMPTKDEVIAAIQKSKESEITAYIDTVSEGPLLEKIPKKSKVISKKENEEFGFTEVKFKNGATAILKPNFYKNDEILFSGFSAGGHSIYLDEDYLSANFTSQVVNVSGLGKFDNIALQKKLAGNTANLSGYINTLEEGVMGSSSPKDIETLLQLNYLYFTAIRKDTSAFKSFISRLENQAKFLDADPNYIFYDTLTKVLNMNHPRAISFPDEDQIAQIDLDRIIEIHKDRFADASDFYFILVGNFAVDTILPLLEAYIGGLPSLNRKETWKNVDPDFPKGITDLFIEKGMEPKSRVSLVMNEPYEYTEDNNIKLAILIDILAIKLRESMREDQGGVYGVRISESIDKYPEPEYSISVSFGCSPDNVDSLINTVFSEMKKIQKEGPLDVDLDKVKETLIRGREVDIKTNAYWRNVIDVHYAYGKPIYSLEEFKEIINNITKEDIKWAANKFLKLDHYVRGVLMPEEKVSIEE